MKKILRYVAIIRKKNRNAGVSMRASPRINLMIDLMYR